MAANRWVRVGYVANSSSGSCFPSWKTCWQRHVEPNIADRADQAVEFGVLLERVEHLPELFVIVRRLEFHLGELAGVEGRAEVPADPVR